MSSEYPVVSATSRRLVEIGCHGVLAFRHRKTCAIKTHRRTVPPLSDSSGEVSPGEVIAFLCLISYLLRWIFMFSLFNNLISRTMVGR